MIRVVLFSDIAEEIQCIRLVLAAYSVRHSWADCQVKVITNCRDLKALDDTADVLISDVSDLEVVKLIKAQKASYPPMRVFPIAGPDIPPTTYVCPEILPCGLFWRPISQKSAYPIVEQMMAVMHDQAIPPSQRCFRISGKQKIQEIPYTSILFFEAREKRIILRMREQELVFGGTLGKLEEDLPEEFIRCHKSFIVNRQHIMSVDRTNSSMLLDNRMELPISRSHKKTFWEVYHADI